MSRHAIVLLAVSVIIVSVWGAREMGFIGPPRCELLTGPDDALRELNWEAIDRSSLPAWIASTFGVAEEALDRDVTADDPNHRRIRWTVGGSHYQTSTSHDTLEVITLRFRSAAPRAQEVIACFGPPSYYRATYFSMGQRNELHVELWYPEEGMIVGILRATSLAQDEPPHVDNRRAIHVISYMRWTEPERMVRIAPLTARNTLDAYPLKPWPGSFAAIEIEIDPAILER